jgi:hypothetical protein
MTISNGTSSPIICFGQQPCGFFPKRYLIAKINTARALQEKIGGKIVFFYHDSDADYRETITLMKDLHTGADVRLNFTQENKLQKKHSPLYLKRIPVGWKPEILKQLPRFIHVPPPSPSGGGIKGEGAIDLFKSVDAKFVADFCLEMYKKMNLLEGIEVMRSSNRNFRTSAIDIESGFVDVEYQGEIVRAKITPNPIPNTQYPEPNTSLSLHEGGDVYTKIPFDGKLSKSQITPTAKDRFGWMQSVVHCTHYIYGQGEKDYLNFSDFPEVKFIQRDEIDNSEFAWLGENLKLKA